MDENEKLEKKDKGNKEGKTGFIVLVTISVLIMIAAIVTIYVYITEYQPDLARQDNSVVQSENIEFANSESPQILENDASDVGIVPLETSPAILITVGVLMFITIIAMIVVKVIERKDNYV